MSGLVHRILYGLFVAGFVGICISGAVLCWPKVCLSSNLRARKADIERNIAEKRREIAAIREQKDRFERDRDFVESLARQDRRVYPGEIVFVFDD